MKLPLLSLGSVPAVAAVLLAACGSSGDTAEAGGDSAGLEESGASGRVEAGITQEPATSDAGSGTPWGMDAGASTPSVDAGTPAPANTPDAGSGTAAPDAGVSTGEVFDPCLICPGYDTTCTQAGTYYQCFRPAGAPGDQCPRDESLGPCEPGYSCSYWSGVGCSANYCLCQDGDWRCTDYKCPESGDCNRLPGRDCDEVGASCDFDALHCECTAADAGNATWSCRID